MTPAIFWPRTLEEACEVLDDYDGSAKVVAGSTALTLMMNQGLVQPEALVSLDRIKGLTEIVAEDAEVRIGAMVRHGHAARDNRVRTAAPVLASTLSAVGNAQVRTLATIGGVMAEADYASDPPAAVLLLDGYVVAQGPGGKRQIAAEDLITGFYETNLDSAEVITEVVVANVPAGAGTAYTKFSSRSAEDRPCVGVAALVQLDESGVCTNLRVCVGAAAERPLRLKAVEASAVGQPLAPEAVADAYADVIESVVDVRGSAGYRTEMVRVWVARAIEEAAERARRPDLSPLENN